MRLVLQRVSEASVRVGGYTVGSIGRGFLVLVGVGRGDGPEQACLLASKVANLRVFEDEHGKSNLSLLDVQGAALVVSQFTLLADCRKGRRPSFTDAADPGPAAVLVERFRTEIEALGVPTASGEFGAHMVVGLVNDGPFTVLLDSETPNGSRS
jgi:D-tyrosyl-tRNA(Tyr) deacylase